MWKGIHQRPRGNPLVPESPQSPCPGLGRGMCWGEAGSLGPIHRLPSSASSHGSLPPAGGSPAWHTGPTPSCQHARLSHSPRTFAAPSSWSALPGGFYPLGQLFLPKVQHMPPPLWSLPWPPQQSRSPHPPSTHGIDSVIAVHVLAGTSKGSASPFHC